MLHKKQFERLLILWICCSNLGLFAQYAPLLADSATWNCSTSQQAGFWEFDHGYSVHLAQDTIINMEVYQLLRLERNWARGQHLTLSSTIIENRTYDLGYLGALREDSTQGKIYFYPFYQNFAYTDSLTNQQVPLMRYDSSVINHAGEVLLYDFNVIIGDTLDYAGHYSLIGNRRLVVDRIDRVQLSDGQFYRRLWFDPNSFAQPWVEGMGSIEGLLFPQGTDFLATGAERHYLECFHKNGINLYTNYNLSIRCDSILVLASTKVPQASSSDVSIYPNPVHEVLTITMNTSLSTPYALSIFNHLGQKVWFKNTASNTTTIHVRDIGPPGMYHLQVSQGNSILTSSRLVLVE